MYSENTLKFDFSSFSGPFDKNGTTGISIANAKALANVDFNGVIGGSQADVTIYGLSSDLMATLSARGIGAATNLNVNIGLDIYANDTLIFSGMIYSCYANMNSMPEPGLVINAYAGLDIQYKSTKPYTYDGTTSALSVIQAIASPFGYSVVSNGIDGYQATNTHLEGSPLQQIRELCMHFGFLMKVVGKEVHVYGDSGSGSGVVAQVGPNNGLIGYPVFTQGGIMYQAKFSPYLAAYEKVKLTTSLPNASGTYMNNVVMHRLSSRMPDGPWMSLCQAIYPIDGSNNG